MVKINVCAVAPKPPGNNILVEDGEGGLAWVDPAKHHSIQTANIIPAEV